MKSAKRPLTFLFFAGLLLTAALMLSPKAQAATYTDVGGVTWTYTLDADSNATITRCSQTSGEVTVPGTVDGYTVVAVGSSTNPGGYNIFNASSNSEVTSVTLPDSMISLGRCAFYSCTNLAGAV